MLGLISMQEALNAKTLGSCRGHRTGATFSIGVPTLSFFLYAIHYAWGAGDVSDTAVPFLDPYWPASLNAYWPTVF